MKLFYSAVAGGFFSSQISGNNVPSDATEITSAEHVALLNGLREGRLIYLDDSGRPTLGDIPVPVGPDLSAKERNWRDQVMLAAIGLRDRHRDQLEIGGATTLSSEQYSDLLVYIQALRDWPQSPYFPDTDHRPIAPAWIVDQTE
ncbi:phage tail protein [Pseudomonas kairouanensis]|uniref:Phage tail protein n=1 Tax=Pseudomonas kairouanensis TaxID=2293832 RepID=A0A4Z0B3A3_9PSED|nr:phage tail assembly chaperone [Pseudomonas kairouanensis]TFY92804.1 phage tail protein [Pseudomonas kairouanensis]